MTTTGRNDPCPCGSGLKYKKCCLARDEAAAIADRPAPTPRETAMAALMRFGSRPEFDPDHQIATVLFWAGRLAGRRDSEIRDLLEADDTSIKYNSWFLFDLDIDDGVTVADMFLARKGRDLDARERAFVDRMRASHLRLYEIQEVVRGEGLHLLDLWTKQRLFVTERAGSTQLVRWDLLGARVVPDEGSVNVIEGGVYLYPASARRDLLRELRRRHRSYVRDFPDADHADFFKRHGMIFHHAWLDLVALRPMPRMVTAEGDEMLFATSTFELHDEDALRRALAARDDVDTQDDGSFVWLEEQPDFRRSLGTVILSPDRVVVETTSKARAERARAWLEGIAGAAVTHRATAFESVASALERHRDASPPADSTLPPEVEAEALQQLQDKHYREWLDRPVPALSNHTPREAAASKTLRPRLVELLKDLDARSERAALEGRYAYDAAWIWAELDIDRATGSVARRRRGTGS